MQSFLLKDLKSTLSLSVALWFRKIFMNFVMIRPQIPKWLGGGGGGEQKCFPGYEMKNIPAWIRLKASSRKNSEI